MTSLVHFTTLLLIKKSEESVIKSAGAPNQHLADELNKPIIPQFQKDKVTSSSMDNLQGANLKDMQYSI